MGLMNNVIDRNLDYISVADLLCYIAYTQNETIKTVVTWLYAQDFEQFITSYTIERYKVLKNQKDVHNSDFLTISLFNRVQDTAFNVISYGQFKNDENADPRDDYFYYKIEDLDNFVYIKELNLEFTKAREFAYTIHIDDGVSAEQKIDEYSILFPHVHASTKSELGKADDVMRALCETVPMYQHIDKIISSLTDESLEEDIDSQDVSDHTRYSYLTTIGILLELMQTPKWGLNGDRALFQSQSSIISEILEKLIKGQGKSTLENRFRDANMVLDDAKKKSEKL